MPRGIIRLRQALRAAGEPFSLFQNALLYRYTEPQWFVDILNQEEGVSFLDQEFIDAAAEGAGPLPWAARLTRLV